MTGEAAPLILTLDLGGAFARFETLRRRHFPKALNRVPAHATLFHHLPGARASVIEAALASACLDLPPLPVRVEAPRLTGRGVAFGLACPPLLRLRTGLAARFADGLTAQDRQDYRPHVTVQNKVDQAAARTLHADLARDFAAFDFLSPGLLLWRYLGGPWEPRAALLFGGSR